MEPCSPHTQVSNSEILAAQSSRIALAQKEQMLSPEKIGNRPRSRASMSSSISASMSGVTDPGAEGVPSGPRPVTRPQASLAFLIGQAILSSSFNGLSLEHIYRWITTAYPYFAENSTAGWRNSVRHTLSMHKMFVKIERTAAYPAGKGGIWTIAEGEECHFGPGDAFTKTVPASHPHAKVCKQWSWEKSIDMKEKRKKKKENLKNKQGAKRNSDGSVKPFVSGSDTSMEGVESEQDFPDVGGVQPLTTTPNITSNLDIEPILPSISQMLSDQKRLAPLVDSKSNVPFMEENQLPPLKRARIDDPSQFDVSKTSLSPLPNLSPILLPPEVTVRDRYRYQARPYSFEDSVALASRYRQRPYKETSYERYSSGENTPEEDEERERSSYYMAGKTFHECDRPSDLYRDMENRRPWAGFRFWIP